MERGWTIVNYLPVQRFIFFGDVSFADCKIGELWEWDGAGIQLKWTDTVSRGGEDKL